MKALCQMRLPSGQICGRPAVQEITVDADDEPGAVFDQDWPTGRPKRNVCGPCAERLGLPPQGGQRAESGMFPGQSMAERYVGLDGETARRCADADARVKDLRYIDLDALGLEFVLNADYRRNRLNLVIRRGRVIEAAWC